MTEQKKPMVLVAEDEPAIAKMLKLKLTIDNYDVTLVANAESALDLIKEGLLPDVMITDYGLAGNKNGVDLIQEARISQPQLPVLMITGNEGKARDALQKCADINEETVVITAKPFKLPALGEMIENAKSLAVLPMSHSKKIEDAPNRTFNRE